MSKNNPTKSEASKAGTKLASGGTSKSTKSDAGTTLSNFGHKKTSSSSSKGSKSK